MFLSLRIKESKALGFREPAVASVSKERFACFLLKAQKALRQSSTLSFLLCLSQIISNSQLEFLEEATNGLNF